MLKVITYIQMETSVLQRTPTMHFSSMAQRDTVYRGGLWTPPPRGLVLKQNIFDTPTPLNDPTIGGIGE